MGSAIGHFVSEFCFYSSLTVWSCASLCLCSLLVKMGCVSQWDTVRIKWHHACQAHQIMPRLIPSILPMPQTWGRRELKGNSDWCHTNHCPWSGRGYSGSHLTGQKLVTQFDLAAREAGKWSLSTFFSFSPKILKKSQVPSYCNSIPVHAKSLITFPELGSCVFVSVTFQVIMVDRRGPG